MTSNNQEPEIYKSTRCRFCHTGIFLYNIDLGEFAFRFPFSFSNGRKHLCPLSLEAYQQYNQQEVPTPRAK